MKARIDTPEICFIQMNKVVYGEIGRVVLDAFVALLLFVVACGFAGAVHSYTTPQIDWLYGVWFVIGMLPCLLYMRHRGAVQFSRWDIIAYAPFPLCIGIISQAVSFPANVVLALFVTLFLARFVRGYLPESDRSESAE